MMENPYNVLSQRELRHVERLYAVLAWHIRMAAKYRDTERLSGNKSGRWSRAQKIKRHRAELQRYLGPMFATYFRSWRVGRIFHEGP